MPSILRAPTDYNRGAIEMARVLIVDDDESERLFQRSVLQKAGHELFFAKTGEEAVKIYLRSGIDVVISDLEMPGGDGFELVDAVAALGPEVWIIVVSGKGPQMLEQARAVGAHVTLSKPIDPRELIDAVAGAGKP